MDILNIEEEKKLLAAGDDATWEAFWQNNAQKALAVANRKLGGGYDFGSDLLGDVRSDAVMHLMKKLRDRKIQGRADAYFIGIIDKLCRKKITRPDRLEPRSHVSVFDHARPSAPIREADDFKFLRRKMRKALQSFRAEIRGELKETRNSRRHAPILHTLIIDQMVAERGKPAKLKEALGLKDSSELTRLRQTALSRFEKHCLVQEVVESDVNPETLMMALVEAWTIGLHGCQIRQICPKSHPSHEEDITLQEEAHVKLTLCRFCQPVTCPEEAAAIQMQIELFMTTTSTSLASFGL